MRPAVAPSVGGLHALDEIAAGGDPTGGELAAPPLDLDGVLAQPRVAGAGRCDGRPRARRGRRSIDSPSGDAEAALGDQQVGHRRRPVAGAELCRSTADGRAPSAPSADRPSRGGARSSSASACQIGQNFSIALTPSVRRAACVAWPRTRSRNVSAPELAGTMSSSVGSAMTQASARHPRRSVANVPRPPSSSPCTDGQHDVATQADARPRRIASDRPQRGDQPGLHVARAAPVEPTVADRGAERVDRPRVRIADRARRRRGR